MFTVRLFHNTFTDGKTTRLTAISENQLNLNIRSLAEEGLTAGMLHWIEVDHRSVLNKLVSLCMYILQALS